MFILNNQRRLLTFTLNIILDLCSFKNIGMFVFASKEAMIKAKKVFVDSDKCHYF